MNVLNVQKQEVKERKEKQRMVFASAKRDFQRVLVISVKQNLRWLKHLER